MSRGITWVGQRPYHKKPCKKWGGGGAGKFTLHTGLWDYYAIRLTITLWYIRLVAFTQ